jgi:hypothetical protein
MLHPMTLRAARDAATAITRALLVVGLVAGCVQTSIPPGAQQVRLVSTSTAVTIAPATVKAGQVYFLVEGPGALFLAKSDSPGGFKGFSEADVAHVAATGDVFHTSMQDLTSGYRGSVQELGLTPGRYIMLPIPTSAGPDVNIEARHELCQRDPIACDELPPLPITVLVVVP